MIARKKQPLLFVLVGVALIGVTSALASATIQADLSPADTLIAYYQAVMSKDIVTAKKYLSAGTLRLMEERARRRGKSVDEAMSEDAGPNLLVMPEFANEKITGAAATVDVTSQVATITLPMVKEDGEWKLALDKLLEDSMPKTSPSSSAAPAAEGDYTEDEEHELFQAVGITQDKDLIVEVSRKLGLIDSKVNPTPKLQAFLKAHFEWAEKNREFVEEYRDKEKAREYVMAHK